MSSLASKASVLLTLACAPLAAMPQALGPDGPVPSATLRQVERAIDAVIALEDSATPGMWPYEGALRDQGVIPLGFRVGGTGYVVATLATLPVPASNPERVAAIERGVAYLIAALDEPGMSENIHPGFDLRLWGMITSARALLAARAADVRGDLSEPELDRAIGELLRRLVALEIPRTGGWTYNRPSGRLLPASAYSYVTADVLQVLYEARRQGFAVNAEVVERGLDVLASQREDNGAFAYRGSAGGEEPAAAAGSAARMMLCETTLYQAGRTDLVHVRGALDAFFTHWSRLDERRGRTDLHTAPFGIAPYYFLYAHAHAGRAIELLPLRDRAEYRARLAEKLADVRDEETGLWNDRVYRRSAAYGTSAAALALTAPLLSPLPTWE